MRRAPNGYDWAYSPEDGRRQRRWTSIRRNDNSKQAPFGEDLMKHWLIGLLLLLGPPAFAQQAVPTIEFDSIPNPLRLPTNMYFGEVSGVAVNSKGHVFVLSRGNTTGPAYAAAATQLLEFDAERQVRPRDRQEPLRLVVRAHGARRSGRQHLGHRQGLGHGDQVRSRGPRRHGVRPQAGSLRRRDRRR